MTYPLPDSDASWINYDGVVRVRCNPNAAVLQLLVSVDNGDGTHSVSCFNVSGSLRDTRRINTAWPAYAAPTTPRFTTEGDTLAAEALAAQSHGRLSEAGSALPPVAGGNVGH